MGVHGLWRLVEPSGKPVPLETLENKILAVDVSIWLHQAIKGYQDSKGQPVPNAHLLGIYHRVCKLLYFKIRPIFVFDGGVPVLKKQVIAKRSQLKIQKFNEANDIQKQLIKTLLKHSAVNKILSENTKAKISTTDLNEEKTKDNDIYKLPPSNIAESSFDDEDETTTETDTDSSPNKQWDLHTIDEKSVNFKSLPVEVRHEILTELKDTRKQSSWGRIHEMPRQSDGFSTYQMKRLLKRHSVQTTLEEVEKEMGGHTMSLGELESILNDHGVITNNKVGQRIASDENTRFFLIKDVQKAIENAKKKITSETIEEEEEALIKEGEESRESNVQKESDEQVVVSNKDYELDNDLKRAIELSLQDMPSTSRSTNHNSILDSFINDGGSESDSSGSEVEQNVLTAAKNYMVEYSGLSCNEITKILGSQLANKKTKIPIRTRQLEENVTLKKAENVNNSTDVNLQTDKSIVSISNAEMSESDSDDFEEVVDEQKSELTSSQKSMEIIINPTENLPDEDLFADIFKDTKDVPLANTSLQTTNSEVHNNFTKSMQQSDPIINDETHSIENDKTELIEFIPTYEKPLENVQREKPSENVQKEDEEENRLSRSQEIKNIVTNFIKDHVDVGINANNPITTEQLKAIDEKLEMRKNDLISERSNKERLSNNITDQMYQEAQELLELFGIPYIIAPMEAEAQCAFLNEINLTDGTITDDSDIWLFGGKTVYKDFFNQNKLVKEYQAENIKHVFKLTREQMILLALLVGSDYTTGIQGIGPVTALEILAAFPPTKQNANLLQQLLSGLQEFRSWLVEGKKIGPGRTTLRNKLKNIQITENFPSLQVIQAYLDPKVDNSKEQFSWGKPDMTSLIDFAKKKFGWNQKKSEEILKPVLKRMQENLSQKSIKDYFKTKHKIDSSDAENKMSKRVKKAVEKIGKGKEETNSDEDLKVLKETKKRSKKKVKEIEKEVTEELDKVKQTRKKSDLHKKEVIPQKEKVKTNMLRSKLKAIEVFRKSKQGPGYVKKRKKEANAPKQDAELSESSSD